MNWKEEFDRNFFGKNGGIYMSKERYDRIKDFIESLLEEQRKDLINKILSEEPEDRKPVQIDNGAFTL